MNTMLLASSLAIVCFIRHAANAAGAYDDVTFENELYGDIKSPNYPSEEGYPEHLNITWTIRVRDGFRVTLTFTDFDLEDSYDDKLGEACVYDYVKIYDGTQERKYCGSIRKHHYDVPRIREQIFSTGNSMILQMVSDYSNEEPYPVGFRAIFKEQDRDECAEMSHQAYHITEDWDIFLYCNHFCNNVLGSYTCSCRRGFILHENHHTCTHDCAGKVLQEATGEISTADYPYKYSKLTNCDWTIKQKEGIKIEFRFVGTFSIESHYDHGCVYDWVQYQIGDGDRSEQFCGQDKPSNGSWIITTSNIVKIYFNSDLAIEQSGFKLEYRTKRVKCIYKPKPPTNGRITTPTKTVYQFEDKVEFKCDIGYRMIGDAEIQCQSNREWSAKEPTCEIKHCKQPSHLQSIPNGRIKDEQISTSYGSVVTFWCHIWYEMVSGTSVWRCGDDEQWHEVSVPVANNTNGNAPKCQPICGLKGNDQILTGTYDFGDVIPDVDDVFLDIQVVGGKLAKEAEWPWIVYIDLFSVGLSEAKEFCGGSLLSADTVVTAAHCTEKTFKEQISVYVGMTNRTKTTRHTQVFSVKQLEEHPEFQNNPDNFSLFDHDIAILKLNDSVKIGKYARPICLPRSEREKSLFNKALIREDGFQERGIVAGWGITELGSTPNSMMMARIPPIRHDHCEKHVEHGGDSELRVTNNMICAGVLSGERDSCQGDSGGPYMFKDIPQRRWILHGIVSFGSSVRDCGNENFGMYTDVTKYVPWLEAFLVD